MTLDDGLHFLFVQVFDIIFPHDELYLANTDSSLIRKSLQYYLRKFLCLSDIGSRKDS